MQSPSQYHGDYEEAGNGAGPGSPKEEQGERSAPAPSRPHSSTTSSLFRAFDSTSPFEQCSAHSHSTAPRCVVQPTAYLWLVDLTRNLL